MINFLQNICDGHFDCEDGWDESPHLCIGKGSRKKVFFSGPTTKALIPPSPREHFFGFFLSFPKKSHIRVSYGTYGSSEHGGHLRKELYRFEDKNQI